jgi:RNA polymerase sigma-70 factor (ECF subfamily)
MTAPAHTVELADLLAHTAWMNRLARCLVRDDAVAEDLVQETLVVALEHPPHRDRPVRPWLRQVVRNLARMRRRSDVRRASREQSAHADEQATATGCDRLLEKVQLQGRLVKLVLALPEPYRSAIVLRFYEDLTTAEIAARQGVAAGTARWRLHEGLARLRSALDGEQGGDRAAWQVALAPLASQLPRSLPLEAIAHTSKGALGMSPFLKIGAFIFTICAALLAVRHRSGNSARPATPVVAAQPAQAVSVAPPAPGAATPRARLSAPARAALLARIEDARCAAHTPVAIAPPGGGGSAAGELDKDYIRQQVRELQGLLTECYEQALGRGNPNLAGKIVVRFTIVAEPGIGGLVSDSSIDDENTSIADAEMRQCVQETMYAAQFRAPDGGGEVRVSYPFAFQPDDQAPARP